MQDLGWNTWDTTKVWPEFQTGEGRVDFALCHPESQPAVFVEVKQPGRAEDGVRQALEYAFHTGVPFVVLTDGKTWSFYLPAEKGSYEERRVYKLDLFERSSDEIVSRLTEYLQHDRVVNGAALEAAREQYRTRNKQAFARQTIPTAWQELVGEGEPVLVELVQMPLKQSVAFDLMAKMSFDIFERQLLFKRQRPVPLFLCPLRMTTADRIPRRPHSPPHAQEQLL